ncbi:eukaryotic translation initiation factor 3 subunit A [Neodiprion pinetum]|uniref:eukaryotic translation initiation factor 3 subunit A n=1 Tax=Neodiprion pinetum TaxID=441929 RepID=UPI001EDF871B|nr:eukaryotic translation initiation factor 3 subunit A [Neodiprion pinetum]
MARYGQRPENALKRANEFIEVGKPARALDTLQEVFRNKKWTYNWSESVLEPIMFKYLDLCVELKKSHIAKEGLFQYRNMFQSVNVGSLENVIRGYLRMAEEKTEAARKQSQQAVIDIDDLDNLATPESILLSAVSGEDAQDRSDRTILTPWVKFLWESYCQCLELLRTNAHVETLYHDIARMAFQFCLEYNRKTEFRKLCEKLRKHLEEICKLPPLVSNVSINKAETQQLNLETRLNQLDSAIQMELWQEAYKAIEDIHGLMNLSKKPPVPKTMANYYQKLAMVFWKAGNYLFHAAALFKLLQLSREMKKNMSLEEQQRMANRVLLATLSIPLPSAHPEFDRFIETDKSPLEKAQRLAVLLGLTQPPTRVSLLKDIVRLNVVNLASPHLQDLYSWLEVEFHPLELCTRVETIIQSLQADENSPLVQYVPALQDVTLVRLVRQISQVYQTVQFARLIELAKFTTDFHLERLLVDCVRYNDMQIRIDHGKKCIHFGVDLSEAQREDHPDGPVLQAMPSEQIRCQLVNMATVLHRAVAVINPNKKKVEREKLRTQLVAHYHETKVKEHQRILGRHKIIEERKEYIEHINNVREEEEMRRQEELQRQQKQVEQKRLELEREEREKKRYQSEMQQIKERHLKERMQQISQTKHGQRVLSKLDGDEKLDAEQIAVREAEELQKERREMQQKLKSQEKKVDYLERAKRLEEIPLLEKAVEEKNELAKQQWEQQEAERIAAAIEERQQAVKTRERMARMKEDHDTFLERILAERRNIYLEKLNNYEVMIREERARRLLERKIERKEERRIKWERERAEAAERKRLEEQRAREEEERKQLEELRLQREEEERILREEEEAKEQERMAKLERQAEIRRAREAEIERKQEEDRAKSADTWRRGVDREVPRDRDFRDGPRDRDIKESTRLDGPPRPSMDSSWRRGDAPRDEGSRDEPERWKRRELETRRDDDNVEGGWKRREPERRDNRDEDDRFNRREPLKDGEEGERWKRLKEPEEGDRWKRPIRDRDDNRDREDGDRWKRRTDDRDRDRGERFERREPGGRGGFDRMNRDDRSGMDRDRDRGGDRDRDRDRGMGGGGSWRDAPREAPTPRSEGPPRGREERGEKDTRFRRDGPPRSSGNLEWRRGDAPPPRDSPRDPLKREERRDDRDRKEERPPPRREERREPPPAENEGWSTVSRR